MKLFALLFLIYAGMQCSTEQETLDKEQEQAQLKAMYDDLVSSSESVSCTDAEDWKFTAIGAKACGGPAGYIAYAKSINEEVFLQKVEAYTTASKAFNEKWGIMSDCSLVNPPTAVICENGKPKLIYE